MSSSATMPPAEMLLETLDTAVIELREGETVRTLNSAAEHCLGISRERAVGQAFSSLGGVPDELRAAVSATREDRHRRHVRECRLPGGLYDCNIQALADDAVLLELYDLRWEQQLQNLKQREVQTGMFGLLGRHLGHEIRNPLGGIRGAAQMMAAELEGRELGTLAMLIMREVDRINELIERFGQPPMQHGSIDIHRVIDEAIELLQVESGGAVQIVVDYDPSIPELRGDASALRQVMLNLALNAWQSGAETIRLRTRVEVGAAFLQPGQSVHARVDIEDDGGGVPEAIRPMLFLPLVTGRRDGTGLGLALSQQIAAAHGGLLSYEAMDNGSRFSLHLPLKGSEETPGHD